MYRVRISSPSLARRSVVVPVLSWRYTQHACGNLQLEAVLLVVNDTFAASASRLVHRSRCFRLDRWGAPPAQTIHDAPEHGGSGAGSRRRQRRRRDGRSLASRVARVDRLLFHQLLARASIWGRRGALILSRLRVRRHALEVALEGGLRETVVGCGGIHIGRLGLAAPRAAAAAFRHWLGQPGQLGAFPVFGTAHLRGLNRAAALFTMPGLFFTSALHDGARDLRQLGCLPADAHCAGVRVSGGLPTRARLAVGAGSRELRQPGRLPARAHSTRVRRVKRVSARCLPVGNGAGDLRQPRRFPPALLAERCGSTSTGLGLGSLRLRAFMRLLPHEGEDPIPGAGGWRGTALRTIRGAEGPLRGATWDGGKPRCSGGSLCPLEDVLTTGALGDARRVELRLGARQRGHDRHKGLLRSHRTSALPWPRLHDPSFASRASSRGRRCAKILHVEFAVAWLRLQQGSVRRGSPVCEIAFVQNARAGLGR
eukprot:scaffold262_cov230-Pinguiococcus_pyrenoidosus.AAC.5